jgi:nickel/cobalt transporter (NiCoT) family protein
MCLIDTMDGALMLTLYILPSTSSKSPTRAKDPVTFLYYSIVLTCLTVFVAIVIGVIQLLTMIDAVAEPHGKFWDGVELAGEYYDIIGGVICGSFIVVGLVSVVAYKPWRRRVERKRRIRQQGEQIQVDEEEGEEDGGREDELEGEVVLEGSSRELPTPGRNSIDKRGKNKTSVVVQPRKGNDDDEILRAP